MRKDHFIDSRQQSNFRFFLAFEAVFCLLSAIFSGLKSEALTSIIGFPLQPLALMMQRLSLSGEPGNSMAWCLYIILSLLPAGLFLLLVLLKKHTRSDLLLLLLCALLFYCFEILINPGLVLTKTTLPDGILAFACGSLTDLVLLLWLVLRWSASLKEADLQDPTRALTFLVRLFEIILVFRIFYSSVNGLVSSLQSMSSGSSVYSGFSGDPDWGLAMGIDKSSYNLTVGILLLGTAVNAIPDFFALLILNGLEKLFLQMREEPFSDTAIRLSTLLSRRCLAYLIAGIALEAAFNLIQLLSVNLLLTANFTITLPMVPLLILVIARIFSDYIVKGKALQDDNDSFI